MARDEKRTGKLLENSGCSLWTAGKEGVIQKPRDFGRFHVLATENFGLFASVAGVRLENSGDRN